MPTQAAIVNQTGNLFSLLCSVARAAATRTQSRFTAYKCHDWCCPNSCHEPKASLF